ncbi:ras GEF [Basidiobolus meristosporus CBS 931.73]|uniref:Ras GEF n=1 Tax=Basidiobolus meristosporus CBS 931.73 TaxID=1314790 RepID=A0A1Y1YL76_9FUNG|nr:ras GEF [Basidiobolus meristosporus CBS 931.73]|eukprot:ORX98334.1 ras GEF [Basidiobolus meristosporus CBS 931.73]
MHTDINSENLTLDSTGLILGGTLDALVEYMTQHDTTMDLQFVKIFLLTFRTFTTPEALVESLTRRFLLDPKQALQPSEQKIWTSGKLTPIRLRIYMVFKLWLTLYYAEQLDQGSTELIRKFVLKVASPHLPAESKDLLKLLDQKALKTRPSNTRPLSIDSSMNVPGNRRSAPPVPLLSPYVSAALKAHKGFFIAELDPLELARQFTILESKEFCAIQPYELIDKEFSKKSSISVHVQAMTKLSTAITTWIADCIVREEDLKNRSNILKYFIRVGEKCLQLNNYNTLFSIVSALNSSGVNRLKRTQELLSRKYSVILNQQSSIVNRHKNFQVYRELLQRSSTPCLPFLGLYLTDLTFTYDGNKDFRKEKPDQINMDKQRRVIGIIESMTKFQSPYSLVEVPEIQSYLRHVLDEVNLAMKDIKDIGGRVYNASLTVEPKVNPDGHSNTCMSLDYYMAV